MSVKTLLADTGFLIALYAEKDQHRRQQATDIFRDNLGKTTTTLLLPWPIMYETLATRMVNNQRQVLALRRDWTRLQSEDRLELLNDEPYREMAVDDCFNEANTRQPGNYRPLSLADRVIRHLLSDVDLRVDAFVTFNPNDFRDVCRRSNRNMLP